MDHLVGSVVKGYELREVVGTGGFGAVFRAFQPTVEREVAVKVVLPEHANHPDFVRRFETEARLVARLEHPYIVPLYDYWREPSGAYLVMRYLRAGNLTGLVKRAPLTVADAARLVSQIVPALAVAHRAGVVHRDLKPDNILLDEDGNFYLTDFGIAKDAGTDVNLTQTGTIVGSPAYLSPEQINGEPATPASDQYSVAIMLYTALTGQHPYPARTPTAMMLNQVNSPLPSLVMHRDDLPPALDAVLARAASKNPQARYADVLAFAEAFLAAAGTRAGSATGNILMNHPTLNVSIAADAGPSLAVSNPYKGLRAFEEGDASTFYGREALTRRLVDALHNSRLLAVIGPSGSGKSSVVKAGLIPALRQGALPGSDKWFYVEMLPGAHPMEELEAALLRVAVNPPQSLLAQLNDDERGLVRAVKRVLPDDGSELVLLIDQFEEVFTLTHDERARTHLLASLLAAVNDPRAQMRVIITLRADFYDRPLAYYSFGDAVRRATEVVLPLADEELEAAILGPASGAGVVLEPGLSAAIVADVRDQPGALPLLQYALTQLFDQRAGHVLSLDAYQRIGRALGALARRAEVLYTEMPSDQQEAARQMFLRLVTLGEGAEDTRRRVRQSELTSVGGTGAQPMSDVVDYFGGHRLLTFDRDPVTREPTVEIAHEALIRQWPRLRAWLDGAREDLRMHRRLANAAEEWSVNNRDASYLASGARLDQFDTWDDTGAVSLNQLERDYVAESQAARARRRDEEAAAAAHQHLLEARARNRLRQLVAVLSVAALVAFALATFGITQGQAATRAQRQAEASASEAAHLALAANARNVLAEYRPNLALALALAAVEGQQQPLVAAQQALARAAYAPGAVAQLNPDGTTVTGAAFAPDGTRVAAVTDNGRLLLLDVAARAVLFDLPAHDGRANAVAYSAAGTLVATGGQDGRVRLWDPATGQAVGALPDQDRPVNALAFNARGVFLLVGGGHLNPSDGQPTDGTLLLWHVVEDRLVRAFAGHDGPVLSVSIGRNGGVVASGTAGTDRATRIYDAASGALRHTLRISGGGFVRGVAVAPNGEVVAAASYDPNAFGGMIRLWDAQTGDLRGQMTGHTDVIMALAYSPDGARLISGAWDRTVRVWDVAVRREAQRFDEHADQVIAVAFGPDGRTALSAAGRPGNTAEDQRLLLWDLASRAEVARLDAHTDWVWSARYSPDGTRIATSGGHLRNPDGDNSIRLWDAAAQRVVLRLTGHTNTVQTVLYSPDGTQLASASWDGTVRLWDATTGEQQRVISVPHADGAGSRVYSVAYSPDGAQIVVGGDDGTLRVFASADGTLVREMPGHTARVNTVDWAGTAIASASSDRTARLWDAATGQLRHTLDGHNGWVNRARLHPDGTTLLSGDDDTLRLWDVASGAELRRFSGHSGYVYGAAFSPEGLYVLSGAADTTVRLWDAATGDEVRRFEGHTNFVLDVDFHPAGTLAISAAEDNTARLWHIARGMAELDAWARSTRFVPALTCAERDVYRVAPLCSADAT